MCNGSTPDSDSVCGGSNPSSSAKKKRPHHTVWSFLFGADEGFEPIECDSPVDCRLPPAGRRQHHNFIESLILCHEVRICRWGGVTTTPQSASLTRGALVRSGFAGGVVRVREVVLRQSLRQPVRLTVACGQPGHGSGCPPDSHSLPRLRFAYPLHKGAFRVRRMAEGFLRCFAATPHPSRRSP